MDSIYISRQQSRRNFKFRVQLKHIEVVFSITGILFFVGFFDAFFPSTIITLMRYFVWGTSILLVLVRWRLSLLVARRYFFIWMLTGLALYSFLWSDYPDIILDKNREIMQMTSFAFYMASRYTLLDQVYLLATAFGLCQIFNIAYAVALPSLGTHRGGAHAGSWRGFFDHKNVLGRFSVLSAIVFFILIFQKKSIRKVSIVFLLLSTFLVLSTTSMSALGNLVGLLGAFLFFRFNKWKGKKNILLIDIISLLFLLFYVIVINNWDAIFLSLGRDPTLTGRTYIWAYALERLPERPWLGFGRSVFFDPSTGYILGFSKYIKAYLPPHAHNGFVDLLLEVGIIGLIVFLLSWIQTFRSYLIKARTQDETLYLLPVLFMTFLIIYNMTESILLRGSSIYWILFLMLVFSSASSRQADHK